MLKIKYSIYTFNPPDSISYNEYSQLKIKLEINPNTNVEPEARSFFSFLLPSLLIIMVMILYGLFFGFISIFTKIPPFFGILLTFGLVMCFFSVIYIFLSGPSFATFLKDRKEYYSFLKLALLSTNSYDEFIQMIQSYYFFKASGKIQEYTKLYNKKFNNLHDNYLNQDSQNQGFNLKNRSSFINNLGGNGYFGQTRPPISV